MSRRNKRFCMQDIHKNTSLEIGSIIWALWGRTWWSGIIIERKEQGTSNGKGSYAIYWCGDQRVSQVSFNNVCCFKENYAYITRIQPNNGFVWRKGVMEALAELYQPEDRNDVNDDLLTEWANHGFNDRPTRINRIPDWATKKIERSRKTSRESDGDTDSEKDEKEKCSGKLKELIKSAMKANNPLLNICLGCYDTEISGEHPFFYGSICNKCQTRLKDTQYIIGDDGLSYYCIICALTGNLTYCDNSSCGKAFCESCLDDLATPGARENILTLDKWHCFVCTNFKEELNGVLHIRADHLARVQELFVSGAPKFIRMPAPTSKIRPLRVLSLFDGIAAGMHVLDKLQLEVEVYYASEIDMASIDIVKLNYGDRITHIGDILNITENDIKNMSPIHLVIGGSPCNDLSLVNPNGKGLHDQTGTGCLFFEFYRILHELKTYNPSGFYWLFENVASMPKEYKKTISKFLESEPTLIDAINFSPQHRPRLFWGNLPSLRQQLIGDSETTLQEYLMPDRTALVDILGTITTKRGGMGYPILDAQHRPDVVWIVELEKIFGFPVHYTDAANLSATQRQTALGKSWSIQVVTRLFKFLQDI